ncbi:MAG: PmeII family type II restriction endonuclease [Flexilinea sp.]
MNEKNEKYELFIQDHIMEFHENRIKALSYLELSKVLKRKNIYLFKAKNILTVEEFVRSILDAFLSSREETIFGDFLEKLAIFVCSEEMDGKKSSAEGIDLEFEKDGIRYLVSIKSGPNWGNSGQIKKMGDNFKKAKRILHTQNSYLNIVCVNGCCYGKDSSPDKGEFYKYCGERFWTFISGDKNFYLKIIDPLEHNAKAKNDYFLDEYSTVVNKFSREFFDKFCTPSGKIDWEKLVKFNSSIVNH